MSASGWHLLWIIPAGIVAFAAVHILFVHIWATVRLAKDGTLRVRAGFGLISFTVYPTQPGFIKKLMNRKKPEPKRAEKSAAPSEPKPEKKREKGFIKGVIADVLKLVPDALRVFTIKRLLARWKVGGGDAAKTAVAYGAATAGLPPVYEVFKKYFDVRRSDIYVDPDFDTNKNSVELTLKVYTTGLRVIKLVLKALPVLQKYGIL